MYFFEWTVCNLSYKFSDNSYFDAAIVCQTEVDFYEPISIIGGTPNTFDNSCECRNVKKRNTVEVVTSFTKLN